MTNSRPCVCSSTPKPKHWQLWKTTIAGSHSLTSLLRSRSASRFVLVTLIALSSFATRASAQGLEFGAGWVHVTQDFGTDGFNLGAAWWVAPQLAIAADYDAAWDTSSLTVFNVAESGGTSVKSRLQSGLFGPRFAIPIQRLRKMAPFGEVQFGFSSVKQTISRVAEGTQSNAETGFSWMLGGGLDYKVGLHWVGRLKLDLLRTHIADQGQSRLRMALGFAYTLGPRE